MISQIFDSGFSPDLVGCTQSSHRLAKSLTMFYMFNPHLPFHQELKCSQIGFAVEVTGHISLTYQSIFWLYLHKVLLTLFLNKIYILEIRNPWFSPSKPIYFQPTNLNKPMCIYIYIYIYIYKYRYIDINGSTKKNRTHQFPHVSYMFFPIQKRPIPVLGATPWTPTPAAPPATARDPRSRRPPRRGRSTWRCDSWWRTMFGVWRGAYPLVN